jgi:hypothetical protein
MTRFRTQPAVAEGAAKQENNAGRRPGLIGRRDLIAMVGGAAVAWPLAVRGQERALPLIGFLNGGAADRSQRGIFKPRQMGWLLSLRTVFPRSGARIWYDDQREAHQQIYCGR